MHKITIDRRQAIIAVLFVIALYILIPQLSSFRDSWQLLRHPNLHWTVLAIILTSCTYLLAALTYCFLSLKKLRYHEVVMVQFAAMFINRLLPAGVGAVGANYAYLRHRRSSVASAGTVVGLNNVLGLLGHGLIIAIALLFSDEYSRHLIAQSDHKNAHILRIIGVIIILAIIAGLIFARSRFKTTVLTVVTQVTNYRKYPHRLLGGLGSSMLLTMANVLCLYSCMYALGVSLPFVIVVLIFTFGLSTGTVTPTPGGLGGFEAGLAGGFIAYHVDSSTALAIALLFRLISYWLMLVVGATAFTISQRRHLFSSSG